MNGANKNEGNYIKSDAIIFDAMGIAMHCQISQFVTDYLVAIGRPRFDAKSTVDGNKEMRLV